MKLRYILVNVFMTMALTFLTWENIVPLIMSWSFIFLIMIVNLCVSEDGFDFLAYNTIVFVSGVTVTVINYYMAKAYGVGFHDETIDSYFLYAEVFFAFIAVVTILGFLIRIYGDKRK